jgi:transcriptional regulator with PAS, ATPase and Fis domain
MQSILKSGKHDEPKPPNAASLRLIDDGVAERANQSHQEVFNILESVQDLAKFLDSPANRSARSLIAGSDAMRDVLRQVERVGKSSATVLLSGESGTGKELVARLVHLSSWRANKPYVRVNCAALSESLIESELFGHEQGAFTGANQTRVGRFEWANGGTLLLDEVSEIPVSLQAKLLRVLEEQEYQRVGGNTTYEADVRVVATTNRNLEQEIAAGNFRADLYYRLNVIQIRIPPLRERRNDIPPLVEYFRQCCQDRDEVAAQGFSDQAMQSLCDHDWPGNVRQLRNVIQHLCVLNAGSMIEASDLPVLASNEPTVPNLPGDMQLDEIERHVILSSLQRHNGNKTATARHLGVTARTLANKMKKYRELGLI